MKCVKCNKEGNISVQNLTACEKCFQKIIEKRVRKEIRLKKLISKNDNILIINDGSAEFFVSERLLKNIIKDLPVEIKVKKQKYKLGDTITGKYNKIIIPWNADLEDEYFLSNLFGNKKPKYAGHYKIKDKTYLKLLLTVLQAEVEIFADILKLKFKTRKKSNIGIMLNELEKEYPEVKFSLLKSSQELR